MGVRAQVLSPMPELLSYWGPPAEAAIACRRVNEWIAEQVAEHQGVLYGLGIVPMQDPDLAVEEVSRLAEIGLQGAMVGSNVEGRILSDERFFPVFEALEGAGLSVFVHSFHPHQAAQLPRGPIGSAVSFPQEIATAMGALIATGILDRLRGLRIGASHGAGGLVFTLGRLSYVWRQGGPLAEVLREDPEWYARRIFYDTLLFRPDALRFLIDSVGPEQVFIGSDYPFSSVAPGWPLDEVADQVGRTAVDTIEENSAVAFLGLD